jgi:hypothetical protein
MKRFAVAVLSVATMMLAWHALPAGAAIIDNFEHGEFSLTSTSPNNNIAAATIQSGLAGVIGGARWPGTLIWDQGHTSGSAVFSLDLSGTGDHGATLSIPVGRTATAGCYYPGPLGQGLGLDLTADGASAFQFTFAQDPGNGSLDFDVLTSSDHWASISLTGAGTYQIPFSAFNLSAGDLANVSALYFDMIYTAGDQPVTAVLSDVSTVGAVVPEPATIVIWSLLGAGSWLGLRVWRRPRYVRRQPWSSETRNAIHEIIARGNHPST